MMMLNTAQRKAWSTRDCKMAVVAGQVVTDAVVHISTAAVESKMNKRIVQG